MSINVWGDTKTQFFNDLSPFEVLKAADDLGLESTGRVMQMNSMENRVYEIEIEASKDKIKSASDHFKIIKFYRPGRWSKEQIQEEHDFLFDLVKNDIQAIAPLKIEGESVFTHSNGLFYTVFPKKGGRACSEWTDELLDQMGRLLARLHTTGKMRRPEHRLRLDLKTFGVNNLERILSSKYLGIEYKKSYEDVCHQIFKLSEGVLEKLQYQRIHGDCHHGNILINENPFLIDFDDMSTGPCVQDLWMITPGRDEYSLNQRQRLIDAYRTMSDFDSKELNALEILRALRIIHFSAWIGLRFDDVSFQRMFTTYASHQYWEKEIFVLKEQVKFIQEDLNKSSPYL